MWTSALAAVTSTALHAASRADVVFVAPRGAAVVLQTSLAIENHRAIPVVIVAEVLLDWGAVGLDDLLYLEEVLDRRSLLAEFELQHRGLEDLVEQVAGTEYEGLVEMLQLLLMFRRCSLLGLLDLDD